MFHLYMFLFSTLLFFILTPGILLTIPKKSSKTTVALVHALVFATVWSLTHKCVWYVTEGFVPTIPPSTVPASNPLAVLEEKIRANEEAVNAATKKVNEAKDDYNVRKRKSDSYVAVFAKNTAAIANAKTQYDKDIANKSLDEINKQIPFFNADTANGKAALDKAEADLKALNDELALSKLEYDKAKNAPSAPPVPLVNPSPPANTIYDSSKIMIDPSKIMIDPSKTNSIVDASTIKGGNLIPNTVNTPYNEVPQYIAKPKPANPALISAANILSNDFANFAKVLSTPY